MEENRANGPSKEQFSEMCRRRVPAIIAALQGSIIQNYVYKAVAAEHMPTWVKDALFGVLRPPQPASGGARKRYPRT